MPFSANITNSYRVENVSVGHQTRALRGLSAALAGAVALIELRQGRDPAVVHEDTNIEVPKRLWAK
jgi:hypothetical protein